MPDRTPTQERPTVPEPPAGTYRGTDHSGVVTVVLDPGTGEAALDLNPDWRGCVDLPGLESGIVAAFNAAALDRVIAWATMPTRPAPHGRRRTPPPGAGPPTRTSPPTTPTGPPKPAGHPDTGTGETPDELMAAVTQARQGFAASTPRMVMSWATATAITSSCRRVGVTVRAGRLTAVHLDPTWATRADDTAITTTVSNGLSAALRALTSCAHPPPDVAADLDDVLGRALAASLAPAHTPARQRLSPPPPNPDTDGWPDRVVQVLAALHADDTPWRVVAAAHLRHTADTLTPQSPTRSAFSFGGGALARSYDALHRRTVALLLDGAHSFAAAATHADTAHPDTARPDTADGLDIHPAGVTDGIPVTASTASRLRSRTRLCRQRRRCCTRSARPHAPGSTRACSTSRP